MTFDEWWNNYQADVNHPGTDYSFGEEAWNAAQRNAWEAVFQIVSDQQHPVSREFVKELEAARVKAGFGPLQQAA